MEGVILLNPPRNKDVPDFKFKINTCSRMNKGRDTPNPDLSAASKALTHSFRATKLSRMVEADTIQTGISCEPIPRLGNLKLARTVANELIEIAKSWSHLCVDDYLHVPTFIFKSLLLKTNIQSSKSIGTRDTLTPKVSKGRKGQSKKKHKLKANPVPTIS